MSVRMVAGTLALLALVGAVAAYGAFGADVWRWGCPSDAELNRLRPPAEVVDAFEDHGVDLAQVPLPRVLEKGAPVYRGAVLYRHSATSATAFVLVCKQRCATSRYQLGRPGGGVPAGQRFYMGILPGNNVVVWVTAEGRLSSGKLSRRISPAIAEVDRGVDASSRCYVN